MYVSNFKFFAQFGGEVCEEQIQNMRKTDQKITYLSLLIEEGMGLKNQDHQKLNVRVTTKMYILNSSFVA